MVAYKYHHATVITDVIIIIIIYSLAGDANKKERKRGKDN